MAATIAQTYELTHEEMTSHDYDDVITPEIEEAMAWVEDSINAEREKEVEAELFDEVKTSLTFDEAFDQIMELFREQPIHAYVLEDLLQKKAMCHPDARFGYQTLFVEPLIKAALASKEPTWFNAYRTMPDLNEQVMRLVIGRGGAGLKRFGIAEGALFIWYDKTIGAFKVWGSAPQRECDGSCANILDVTYNLQLAVQQQTDRRYETALARLHRATERRRGGGGRSKPTTAAATRRTQTFKSSDFPPLH